MKVDRNCNLVMSLAREEGGKIHVHAAPLSRVAFDEYAILFGKTFATIHAQGLGQNFGPRYAANILKNVAESLMPYADNKEQLDRNKAVARQLYDRAMAEIHRLTNVIVPTDRGWDTMPFDDAVRRELLDEDDVSEVDNAIVFFTLAWRGYLKADRKEMTEGAAKLWGGSLTSSNVTEFVSSLPTSTAGANSGVSPAPGSSVPS